MKHYRLDNGTKKIIGLVGYAGSGKTTAAKELVTLGGTEVSFAGPLKDICSKVFSVERDSFDCQSKKEVPFPSPIIFNAKQMSTILMIYGFDTLTMDDKILIELDTYIGYKFKTPREIAQIIGTDILRRVDSNIHVKKAIELSNKDAKFLIFSDIRFPNELDIVKNNGGMSFYIKRPTLNIKSDQHSSESYIPQLSSNVNHTLVNVDIHDFRRSVVETARAYLQA